MPKSPFDGRRQYGLFARCARRLGDARRACESENRALRHRRGPPENPYIILSAINHNTNQDRATLKTYCGVENRREAARRRLCRQRDPGRLLRALHRHRLRDPEEVRPAPDDRRTRSASAASCALRTIPVLEDFARDIEAVCPDAWFLNLHEPDGDALRLYACATRM